MTLSAAVMMTLASLAFGAGTASADHYVGRFSSQSACVNEGKRLVNIQSAAYTRYRCQHKGGWQLYLFNLAPR